MRIGLVAGEASGDVLGAGLIRALREKVPDATFEGVAGPAMVAAGCDPWEPADSLAVMGLVEPLRHIPRLLRLRKELVRRWIASPPDVFIGIDAPDFNLGLEIQLRRAGIPTIHYVSPTVWAWRQRRVRKIGRAAVRVLCLFPFEPDFYRVGLAVGFFVLLTAAIVRAVHHYTGVPWDYDSLYASVVVQTSLSIFWGLLGFAGMIWGAKDKSRKIWLAGAGFMALVVIKLFLVDLGNTGTVARIISFIGIGALLLVVGYFAPAPPRREKQ